jgi:hypothetical protein
MLKLTCSQSLLSTDPLRTHVYEQLVPDEPPQDEPSSDPFLYPTDWVDFMAIDSSYTSRLIAELSLENQPSEYNQLIIPTQDIEIDDSIVSLGSGSSEPPGDILPQIPAQGLLDTAETVEDFVPITLEIPMDLVSEHRRYVSLWRAIKITSILLPRSAFVDGPSIENLPNEEIGTKKRRYQNLSSIRINRAEGEGPPKVPFQATTSMGPVEEIDVLAVVGAGKR